MKTARNIFFTALLSVLFVMPAMAKKKPADGCPATAHALHSSNGKNLFHKKSPYSKYVKSGKSTNARSTKKFEKSKHLLNLKGKNPNRHSSTKISSGGFYSFRKHGYSAHIFHSKKRF